MQTNNRAKALSTCQQAFGFGLLALLLVIAVGGCMSRKQRLAKIEARMAGHAQACFATGRSIGDIDSCVRGRGVREPGWATNNEWIYTECEPPRAFSRALYCVQLHISYRWPSEPKPGMDTISIKDAVARRWKTLSYDKFGFAPRM